MFQHALQALQEIHSHRGGRLTAFGEALRSALEHSSQQSPPSSTQAAAQPNSDAGPTDKRHSDLREAHGPTPSRPGGWPEKFVSGASAAAGGVAPEPLDRFSDIACGAAPHRPWQAAPMPSPTNVEQQTQAAAQPEAPAPMSSPGNVGQTQAAAQPNTSGLAPEPSPWQTLPMPSPAFYRFGQQAQAAAQPEAPAPMSGPGNVRPSQAAEQTLMANPV